MSENVIRCSKCGGTVSGETCTACGATGQAIKCEHCGGLCPADARWCPSCGRHLPAPATAERKTETTVAGGAGITRLIFLFALMVVACVLIWKLVPQPVGTAFGVLAAFFLLPCASFERRFQRIAPLLASALLAASVIHLTLGLGFQRPVAPPPLPAMPQTPEVPQAEFAPGVVMARFEDNGKDAARVAHALAQAAQDQQIAGQASGSSAGSSNSFTEDLDADTHDLTIQFDPQISVNAAVQRLEREPGIVFAEPDYIAHAYYTPNDPYYDEPYDSTAGPIDQWFLKKIGAPEAWDQLHRVKSEVRLAIIDTGIDYTHPDLKAQMARDSKGNVVGRNFIKTTVSPLDDNGHGTHCAGIADAATENGVGVAGVGFNSFRLVAAKVLSKGGSGQFTWICRAIEWCADNGCRVESLSLGAPIYIQSLQDSINYAWSKGTIVVAAAGNESTYRPGYPAGCNHVVGVSATTSHDELARFSNYGNPISVGAPGQGILATMPTYPCDLTKRRGLKENYDALNGTSMACPVVSGTVAALLAYQPSLSPTQAIQRIEQTADNIAGTDSGGWDVQFGHGRVNLANAILDRPRKSEVGCFYGEVTDSRNLAVSGATVRCGERSVTTQVDGMFRLANLKPGEHTIEVTAGSKSARADAVIVAGADTNVTIKL